MTDLFYDENAAVKHYDIAFGWERTIEADFLEGCVERYAPGVERSLLDVACGTGTFLVEMAKRGWRVAGVDASAEMLKLARERVPKAEALVEADMADFALEGRYDVATCWLDSITYLLRNEQFIEHFRCVAKTLRPGGLYMVDLEFARWALPFWREEASGWQPHFDEGWSTTRDGIEVYRDECAGPPCDPVAHTYTEHMRFRVTETGTTREHIHTSAKRALHPQELAALISASGVFDLAAWFGGKMSLYQPLEETDAKGRGFLILRRR
ncbi:MAG: class I SAM-dependent methyltransferase [Verrucomicrobia bacterium]|nr:class I SAM-dependent methyltransferase [Verrucomicrobiota bacterium]